MPKFRVTTRITVKHDYIVEAESINHAWALTDSDDFPDELEPIDINEGDLDIEGVEPYVTV